MVAFIFKTIMWETQFYRLFNDIDGFLCNVLIKMCNRVNKGKTFCCALIAPVNSWYGTKEGSVVVAHHC